MTFIIKEFIYCTLWSYVYLKEILNNNVQYLPMEVREMTIPHKLCEEWLYKLLFATKISLAVKSTQVLY